MKFFHYSVGLTGNEFNVDGYGKLVDFVSRYGSDRASRLGSSQEFVGAQIIGVPYVIPTRWGYARRLGIVEFLQVLSGYFDERHLEKVAPKLLYTYGLTHAYGIKIAQQLEKVVEQLKEHPDSRRAMIYIGKPEDGYEVEKPCVQNFQFISEEFPGSRELNLIADIRSWDLVSGFPYDWVVMGGILQVVSHLTGMVPGRIIANAGSAHVYQSDMHKIHDIGNFEFFEMLVRFPNFRQAREWAMDELNRIDEWKSLGAPAAISRIALPHNAAFLDAFLQTTTPKS